MTNLRIHLFGHPRFLEGDTPIILPAPNKVLVLAAYLLLNRQQPVLRDHLAYLLWPDVSESDARANLRRHLHLLRKQLPEIPADMPWVLTTHQTVHWNPAADVWLDVALLEEFDPTAADLQGNEAAWDQLVEAYSGDFLAGLYDDWVLPERYRLEQRFLHLLRHRLATRKQRGDWSGAVDTSRRVLALDPLSEEPYRELMELHYRSGDRAAALAEFDRCQAMLQAEMSAEPMPETLALRQVILSGAALPEIEHALPPPEKPIVFAQPDSEAPWEIADTLARLAPILQEDRTKLDKPRAKPLAAAAGLLLVLIVLAAVLWAAGLLPAVARRPLGAAANAQTLSLSGPDVTQDTWIDKDNPDLLYDSEDADRHAKERYQQVHLMYFGFAYDRVLIRFDLPAAFALEQIPPSAKIQRAVFRQHLDIFVNQDLPAPLPATVSAFRVLRPWPPETTTFNQPWSQPGMTDGVDYDSQPLGSHEFLGETWFEVDITGLVQEWVEHPDRNFGMMLMLTAAPQGAHYWVDTSDYPLADRRPRLDITYTP